MRIGTAYGFLDYGGTSIELIGDMELHRIRANFSPTFKITVLGERNDSYDHLEKIPEDIAQTARAADIYGGVPSGKPYPIIEPKKAADLRYLVMAQDLMTGDRRPRKDRSNMEVAGMLDTVLWFVGSNEIEKGTIEYFRSAVFYHGERGKPEREI